MPGVRCKRDGKLMTSFQWFGMNVSRWFFATLVDKRIVVNFASATSRPNPASAQQHSNIHPYHPEQHHLTVVVSATSSKFRCASVPCTRQDLARPHGENTEDASSPRSLPVSWFWLRLRCSRLVRAPSSVGMVPARPCQGHKPGHVRDRSKTHMLCVSRARPPLTD